MGERGPTPKPANLHLLANNPSKKPLASLLDDVVRPEVAIPEPGAHLGPDARDEWERITPHLMKLGLVTEIDKAALEAYCIAYGEVVWCSRTIESAQAEDPTGFMYRRVKVGDRGYEQMSWVLSHRARSMELLARFLAEFGLSPAQRSRVTASDPRRADQGELPGMEKPAVGGWGAFR